jgi:hypothetical protein
MEADNGTSCLRGTPQEVQRLDNMSYSFSAVPNEINVDKLCHDVALQRDEWPWIGKEVCSLCPECSSREILTHT